MSILDKLLRRNKKVPQEDKPDAQLHPDEARWLYNQALIVRKGRSDKGLNESIHILERVVQEHPGTSAAEDAQRELRVSRELKRRLKTLRQDFQRRLKDR